MKIIAFSGKRGTGKSTCAEAIIEAKGAERVSFAGHLKADILRLGYPEDIIWRKPTPDPIRRLLISHGQAMRWIDADHWVRCAIRDIEQAQRDLYQLVVIDDLRFWNEAEAMRTLGATLVRVEMTDPLYRIQFVPGIDDDPSERDLDLWDDWDWKISARHGQTHELRRQALEIVQEVLA